MGFWHTGYMEFHEPDGLSVSIAPPEPILYVCGVCSAICRDFDQLRQHRFESHPVLRPILYIRGQEVGGVPLRLTRPLVPFDTHALHAKAAEINGRSVDPEELGERLAAITFGAVDVHLRGDVDASFRLQFEIATEKDLEGVEGCFLGSARRGRLDRRAIEDFIDAARRFNTADAYCDGMCEYLYGVLAKERSPESSLPFAEYRDKFNRSAHILRDIQRPLAMTVQALVAFHFNNFQVAAHFPVGARLASAATRFAKWLQGDEVVAAQESGSQMDGLLTDFSTEEILRWGLLPMNELADSLADIGLAIKRDLPEFDRGKLRVLAGEACRASGDYAGACGHARELANNPTFGRWADAILGRGT